jgi:hypothetical protein
MFWKFILLYSFKIMANPTDFDFGYYHAVGICEGEFPQLTIALNKKMNQVEFSFVIKECRHLFAYANCKPVRGVGFAASAPAS